MYGPDQVRYDLIRVQIPGVRVHVFMVMIGDRAAGKKPVFLPVYVPVFKKQQILKADFRFGTRHSKRERLTLKR